MGDDRTDVELAVAAASGDDAAFAVLVRRYVRPATLLAAQVLRDRNSAEDVVQEAFIVIHRDLRRFDCDKPFAPWCFAIVRRLAGNRRARDQRRSKLFAVWGWLGSRASSTSQPESVLIAGLDAAAARRAAQLLAPMQRACFELVAVQGFSNAEVADMQGISESTVRQHVFRARAVLKEVLGGDDVS